MEPPKDCENLAPGPGDLYHPLTAAYFAGCQLQTVRSKMLEASQEHPTHSVQLQANRTCSHIFHSHVPTYWFLPTSSATSHLPNRPLKTAFFGCRDRRIRRQREVCPCSTRKCWDSDGSEHCSISYPLEDIRLITWYLLNVHLFGMKNGFTC